MSKGLPTIEHERNFGRDFVYVDSSVGWPILQGSKPISEDNDDPIEAGAGAIVSAFDEVAARGLFVGESIRLHSNVLGAADRALQIITATEELA
ncbi:hypothetical protein [Paenibacillus polymyxa]|uniref:hypothetical protein n=1 Tax=Paenibacillus polymyxa TaxID=1406 RepID=UPI001ABA6731|nr:hypothetical protein [Paenibacillus polymyxa]MBO3283092.1 hypothetical protein [Paenibacillus polymyxa]